MNPHDVNLTRRRSFWAGDFSPEVMTTIRLFVVAVVFLVTGFCLALGFLGVR